MKKKFLRMVASVLAALLVVTSLNPLLLEVSAAEPADAGVKKTYTEEELASAGSFTFDVTDLEVAAVWGAVASNTDGEYTVSFPSQYSQIFYKFPAGITGDRVKSVTLDVDDTNEFCIKLSANRDDYVAGTEAYWSKTASLDSVKEGIAKSEVCILGLMSTLAEGTAVKKISKVTFELEAAATDPDAPKPEETGNKEFIYKLSELTAAGGYGFSVVKDDNDDIIAIHYNEQYQEARFKIPESVLESGLGKIEVLTDDATNLSIKSIDASGNQIEVSYGTSNLDITKQSDVAGIALMNKTEGAQDINISGVKFVVTGIKTPENPTPGETTPGDNTPGETKPVSKDTLLLTPEDLNIYYRWNASTKPENGVMNFPSNYYEFCANFPEAINAEDIESIKVNVENQTGALAIKVYNTADTSDGKLDETTPCKYGYEGATSYEVEVPSEGVVASLGFMSHKDDAPFTATLKSIEIKLKVKAIVLEGDDLSSLVNPWNGSDIQGPTLNFSSQYQEYRYEFDEAISTDSIESVSIKVQDQGGNICIKFLDADSTNEWFHDYGADGKTEYTYVPEAGKELKKIGFMSMLDPNVTGNYPYGVTIESVTINLKAGASVDQNKNEEVITFEGDTLDFGKHWLAEDEERVSVGNKLTFDKRWDEYVLDFGRELNIERCKSITIKVAEQGGSISFKIYRPADESKGESGDQEIYVTYDKSGSKVYTLAPSANSNGTMFAIMAQAEEKEGVYPYGVTVESIKIVMDTSEYEYVEKGVEYDIIDLRDAVADTMGEDFLIGTAASYSEFADSMEMELVTKHFNALTLGNELKPDAMLKNTQTEKVSLNGVEFDFPVLNYELPESRLDIIVDWNEKHPDKKIKVRGHVLVWHSQTPTWFFREGYSSNGAHVSPEEMNLRLEYYIKSVAEHFTGADSKYKDLFYGWDVVNEAVSDSRGTYRNASENSEWWAVYNSPEFIKNAFVYANRYMDSSVELYYNDYNDTMSGKVGGIEQLLRDVKATPGARIDGMGMQAHYDMSSPTVEAFTSAARKYAAIVDSVQVTELDFKGSTGTKDDRLTKRYADIYTAIRHLREDGVNFTAMTIWGVIDPHSWLQTSNSVGGGSTTNAKQYPLLFDNNYKTKDAFWAIANAGELMPELKNITLVKSVDNKFSAGNEYTFKKDKELVRFIPEWNNEGIAVKVLVPDTTADESDAVTVYVTAGTAASTATKVLRSECKETSDGYEAVVLIASDIETIKNNKIKLDIVVSDNGKSYAFADTRIKQETETDYYAGTIIKASELVDKGTITVDGNADDAEWANATDITLAINNGSQATATAKLLWDDEYLYVLANVKDAVLDDTASADHEKDSIEVFIDENNHKSGSYEEDDKQYRINFKNEQTFNGTKCKAENVKSAVAITEDGYVIEAAFKWTDITVKSGMAIGFDIQVNDAESGARAGTLNWADASGNGWSSTEGYGTIILKDSVNDKPEVKEPEEEKKDEPVVKEPEEEKKDEPVEKEPEEEKKDEPVVKEPEEEKKDEPVVKEPEEEKKDEPVVKEPEEEKKDEPVVSEPEEEKKDEPTVKEPEEEKKEETPAKTEDEVNKPADTSASPVQDSKPAPDAPLQVTTTVAPVTQAPAVTSVNNTNQATDETEETEVTENSEVKVETKETTEVKTETEDATEVEAEETLEAVTETEEPSDKENVNLNDNPTPLGELSGDESNHTPAAIIACLSAVALIAIGGSSAAALKKKNKKD